MVFIVPDQILERKTCSQCDKYLSVMPVKVYPNGLTKCGRCQDPAEDPQENCEADTPKVPEENGAWSFYNAIVEDGLFHCINRYDGCEEIMLSSKVELHEDWCGHETQPYGCPFCEYSNTSYFMYRHLKTNHQDYVLEKNEFQIDVSRDLRNVFVYCENFVIYVVYVDFYYYDNPKKLELSISCLRQQEPFGRYNCTVSNLDCTMPLIFEDSSNIDIYTQSRSNKLFIPIKGDTTSKIKIKVDVDLPVTINMIDYKSPVCDSKFTTVIEECRRTMRKKRLIKSKIHYCGLVPIQLVVGIDPEAEDEETSFSPQLLIDPEDTWNRRFPVCRGSYEIKLKATMQNINDFSLKVDNVRFSTGKKVTVDSFDWSNKFMPLYDILSLSKGYIKDDEIIVVANVKLKSCKKRERKLILQTPSLKRRRLIPRPRLRGRNNLKT